LELSGAMSALCQKQTFCAAAKNLVIRSPRQHGRESIGGIVNPSALAVFRINDHFEAGWLLHWQIGR
jgi:hypothetical protein